ncbi:hypothetical protein EDC65_1987 [Stella humosa]|uniref:Uncharacterized protein n=1 Tax=Stella humosa TaxID=94 RepID=A0A3N1M927_9PROT|nr:hypothetical protein [Stella humosa]ROQ00191.1 hypothetical protein EDC65_1987 [Stella humosa]BBK30574.1 hypothetical protein STHU_12080 [Stella humosa]
MEATDRGAERRAAARRRAEALALRTAGLDYGRIAASPDGEGPATLFPSATAARRAVARALREAGDEPDVERRLQARRLDRALAGAWTKADGGDGPAIDRILAIETRRARLLALDLPEDAAVDDGAAVQQAAAEVARRLQRLADLLNARAPRPPAAAVARCTACADDRETSVAAGASA